MIAIFVINIPRIAMTMWTMARSCVLIFFTLSILIQYTSCLTLSPKQKAAAERISLLARSSQGRKELEIEHFKYFSSLMDSAADAAQEQEQQGQGFEIPFYPGNSSVFEPSKSSTFSVVKHAVSLKCMSGFRRKLLWSSIR